MLTIVQKNIQRYGLHVTITEVGDLHLAYTTGLSVTGQGPDRVALGSDSRTLIRMVCELERPLLGPVHPDWHTELSVATRYHLMMNLPLPSFGLVSGPPLWLQPRSDTPVRRRAASRSRSPEVQ